MDLLSSGDVALTMLQVPSEFGADRPTFIFQGKVETREGAWQHPASTAYKLLQVVSKLVLNGLCTTCFSSSSCQPSTGLSHRESLRFVVLPFLRPLQRMVRILLECILVFFLLTLWHVQLKKRMFPVFSQPRPIMSTNPNLRTDAFGTQFSSYPPAMGWPALRMAPPQHTLPHPLLLSASISNDAERSIWGIVAA